MFVGSVVVVAATVVVDQSQKSKEIQRGEKVIHFLLQCEQLKWPKK
jgi:hypothetical protein